MDGISEELFYYFPKLREDPLFRVTSPDTFTYNCIAWAMGDDTHRVWPWAEDHQIVVWPEGIPHSLNIRNLIRAFNRMGYRRCTSEALTSGKQKVAIFANKECNEFTHAARQLPDGSWTSKIGDMNDIRHSLHALEGDIYGNVAVIMQKTTTS